MPGMYILLICRAVHASVRTDTAASHRQQARKLVHQGSDRPRQQSSQLARKVFFRLNVPGAVLLLLETVSDANLIFFLLFFSLVFRITSRNKIKK